MHIVFLNTAGQMGGAERSLVDLIVSLRQAQPGWRFTVITGEAGPFSNACEEAGASACVVVLPRKLACLGDWSAGVPGRKIFKTVLASRVAFAGGSALRYTYRLRSLLNELQPDLVHTNGLKMHLFGAWATPPNVPLVWHLHEYVSPRPLTVRLLCHAVKRCDAVVANSRSVANDFQNVLKAKVAVHTVWNGIDLQEFSPEGSRLDLDAASRLEQAPAGTVRIGLVGTFAKHKGHHVFLEALAMLPPGLQYRAYVIGGPLYQTEASQWRMDDLKKRAAVLGLSERVGFTGFVTHPADAIRSLDIVVHATTTAEPFGLVIAEAMACRRALVASCAGGATEIFRDGVNALGHTPGNAREIAALIVKLAGDAGLRMRLGEEGRRTAERNFDRARLGAQLVAIYGSAASLFSGQTA